MEVKFRKLTASEVECRIGSCSKEGSQTSWCDLLLYKDARADMRLLDEAVGPMNWKREHAVINSTLYCTISIYNADTSEWVSKQDVGTESNTEKEKGAASDSFKRAAVNWGIGRELYTAPHIRIFGGGKYTQARVTELGYDAEGNINELTIVGRKNGWGDKEDTILYQMKDGREVRQYQKATPSPAPSPAPAQPHGEISEEIRKRAEGCGSLAELKEYQTILVTAALWNNDIKNYFNNLAKKKSWI